MSLRCLSLVLFLILQLLVLYRLSYKFNNENVYALVIIFKLVFLKNTGNAYCENASQINILDHGGASDSTMDNSEAFLKAWNATCNSEADNPMMIIPDETFLVYPVVFSGPCKARNITILLLGEIVAPALPDAWKGLDPSQWLVFRDVSGLHVAGQGTINGQGLGWWNQSCRYHPHLTGCTTLAPTALKFISCSKSVISSIFFVNSPQAHVSILRSNWIDITNVAILSPGNSPNTDGIHIHSSNNVRIQQASIKSGDDCISIGDYTYNVYISFIRCAHGHGISIGSLGKSGNSVQVEKIHVSRAYLEGTTNGARIKTWQVGKGYVRGITFENFYLNSVRNPIVIDQNYCNVRGACKELSTGVHISDVTYGNFYGTSSSDVAINLNCSQSIACTNIVLQSIQVMPANPGQVISSFCNNAHGRTFGVVQPESCLQN